jgi:hypothetical protein
MRVLFAVFAALFLLAACAPASAPYNAMPAGQLPKAQEEDVFKTKEGEFSTADEAQSLSFTQVIKHEQAPLKDVSKEIEVKLREQKITDSLNNLKKAANVWMDPEYFGPPAPPPAPAAAAPPPSESKPPSTAPKPTASQQTSP